MNAGPGFAVVAFKRSLKFDLSMQILRLDEVANYWEQVILLNEWQKTRISKLIIETFFGTFFKKITLLGFSFKSNTNDTRESPAIKIAREL